jgi:AcrR family transcriptional regulator
VTKQSYHHGDLRRALLDAAAEVIADSGPAALSLRDLARRAGVSHAGPQHHFGDKAGLLTALAAEGYDLLAAAQTAAGTSLLEQGVAYVRFAAAHRAHFEVMFRPDLYHPDNPGLAAARDRSSAALRTGVASLGAGEVEQTGLAAWSIAHGFATLWVSGAIAHAPTDDPGEAARTVLSHLARA